MSGTDERPPRRRWRRPGLLVAVLVLAAMSAGATWTLTDQGDVEPVLRTVDDVPLGGVRHGEQIDLDNTGPRTDDLEQAAGEIVTERDGQVIEGLRIAGSIKVMHDDVTIRDVEIVNDGEWHSIWSPHHSDGGTGTTVEWVRIDGKGNVDAKGIALNGDTTVYRTAVIGHTSGMILRSGDRLIESYSGDRAEEVESTDAHGSGASSQGANDIEVVRSNIGGVRYGSSALSLYPRVAPIQDALIQDNLFNGGSYCLYAGDTSNHPYRDQNRDIRIVGNKFGTRTWDDCGQYGPYTAWNGSRPGNEWSDNTWQETGEPID